MKYRDPNTGQFKDLHVKISDTVPIGFIGAYSGATAPDGWLICDGAAVSRTAYSALFAAIGTTYGAGDGSTTFNLPDYRDRVPVGLDANDSDFNVLGKKLGSKSNTYNLTHSHTQGNTGGATGNTGSTTLTVDQIPSHKHGYRDYYTTDITTSVQTRTCVAISSDGTVGGIGTQYTGGGQGHTHSLNNHTHTNPATNNALGNTSISTIQQSIVTNYIIKAYQVVAVPGKVVNEYSESTKDAYSADYVNSRIGHLNTGEDFLSLNNNIAVKTGTDGSIFVAGDNNNVVLRPNGHNNTEGQAILNTSGILQTTNLEGVTLKSSSSLTGLTIKSVNGYGIVMIIGSVYICIIQLTNNEYYIHDVYGEHQDVTVSVDGDNQFTVSGLYNWDHYIIIGSDSIQNITFIRQG